MFWNYTIDNMVTQVDSQSSSTFSRSSSKPSVTILKRSNLTNVLPSSQISISSQISRNCYSQVNFHFLFKSEKILVKKSSQLLLHSPLLIHCHYQVFDPFKFLSCFPNMTKYITHFPKSILLGPWYTSVEQFYDARFEPDLLVTPSPSSKSTTCFCESFLHIYIKYLPWSTIQDNQLFKIIQYMLSQRK